jgi:uncharacterized protein (TIGR02147 family)
MRPWIFQEKSYKKVIKKLIEEAPESRGMISKISSAIGCQRSYLSQVLHTKVQLTRDQAWGLCEFFGLGKLEARFFECLVDYERATLPLFRQHLEAEMAEIRREFERLSHRFEKSTGFNAEQAQHYYSYWLPSALHILVSIPAFQDLDKIAKRLGVSKEKAAKTLATLQKAGLVEKKHNQWKFAGGTKFIAKESPFVSLHHQNWRQLGVEDSRNLESDGLHFTMVQTMSKADFEKLKMLVVDFIDKTSKIAGPSDPQLLTAFTLDFFQPKGELLR